MEHIAHGRHVRNIPAIDGLVKRRSREEHITHVCHARNIPAVHDTTITKIPAIPKSRI
ncbi:MAG: hypothetical protein WBH31_01080 [Promethearchaeia archaeon]